MIVINCVCFDEVQFDVEVLQFQQWCDVLAVPVMVAKIENRRKNTGVKKEQTPKK